MRFVKIILLLMVLMSHRSPAENLVPNGSFETGANQGWLEYETASAFLGNACFSNGLITNNAYDGSNALLVLGRVMGRGGILDSNTYTVSVYAKRPAGSGGMYFGLLHNDALYAALPTTLVTVTTSWVRYSSTFTTSSNGIYRLKIYPLVSGILIDNVQIEVGSSATTYAPAATVECGLTVPGTNSMYFFGDTPKVRLNYWNTGAAATQPTRLDVFDAWNSNVYSATLFPDIAIGSTALDVSLAGLRYGWHRVVSRLTTINDSSDEVSFAFYPYASNVTWSASDWLGGHPNIGQWNLHREMLANRHNGRSLSPGHINTRWDLVEASRGVFNWYDPMFTAIAAEGLNMLGCLTPSDGNWPHWATNQDGMMYNGTYADLNAFSNFCFMVVDRYKTVLREVEIGPNEPFQSGPTGPGAVIDTRESTGTNYAKCLSAGISGVTNADPTVRIVAIAGAYGGGEWAENVLSHLTPTEKSWIYAISTHIYPQDFSNLTDPNVGEFAFEHFSNHDGWRKKFGGTYRLWNTESGSWQGDTLKGWNAMMPINYDPYATVDIEAFRNEQQSMNLLTVVRVLTQGLRCIGQGFERYYYYDSRIPNDENYRAAQPYAANMEVVDRPDLVSLSTANSIVARGFGPITNVSVWPYIEAYSCTGRLGQVVVPIWCPGRTNRIITLTNTAFSVYDCYSNFVQYGSGSFVVRRVPQYIVATNLTLAQMSNDVRYATAPTAADTIAPHVSIDIAPSGTWSGDTNRQFIKWTALDDWVQAWRYEFSCTNVMYRYRIDAEPFSGWSMSNHLWRAFSAGNHTIQVNARDTSGNIGSAIYDFTPGATNTIRISDTWTLGTLNIGP